MKTWQKEVDDRIELPQVSKPAPRFLLTGNDRKPINGNQNGSLKSIFKPRSRAFDSVTNDFSNMTTERRIVTIPFALGQKGLGR